MSRQFTFLLILLFMSFGVSCSGDNTTSGDGDGDTGSFSFSHSRGVGASAQELLSDSDFGSLTIEIDYVTGYEPTQTALTNLESFLESRLNKPGGITIVLDDEIPATADDSITVQEVRDLETEYRDTFTTEGEIAVHFLFLDGSFQQENVLGIAYLNTSMSLFSETIDENTGGLGQPSASTVESAVLMHEFGHILGLVDNGSPAVQDHVDEQNGSHCDVDTCLMYWAIQTTDLMGNLTGGDIPELDSQCIQDLQANGGK